MAPTISPERLERKREYNRDYMRKVRVAHPERVALARKKYRDSDHGQQHEREYDQRYFETHRDQVYRKNARLRFAGQLMYNHGLTVPEYRAMVVAQQYVCAICREEPKNYFVVDHDHGTNAVRALLCHSCNVAIGLFKEDAARLRQAAEYLEHHTRNPKSPLARLPRRIALEALARVANRSS